MNYKEAIKVNKELCKILAVENCLDLANSISKKNRLELDDNILAENIADALISMEWIVNIYNIKQDLIEDWLKIKEDRIVNSIKENNFR